MKHVVLAFIFAAGIVSAYAAEAVTIGYVDMRKVLSESKGGQRVKAELEKTIRPRQEALTKEEERLKALQQAYERDKLLLSEAQRQEKQKEFQQKFEAFQKSAGELQREVSQKENEFTKKAVPEIQAIIRAIAQEEKLTLVFEKHQIPAMYAADGPDLTDKVLQRYNRSQK